MALTRVRFNEGSTGVIEGDIVDDAGAPVPTASLTAATLTLWDYLTGVLSTSPAIGILNGRDHQDILNAHDVTIGNSDTSPETDGHFTWQVQPADNVIVTPRRQVERHRALFAFTWAEGAFQLECEIEVVNLRGAN